MNGKHINYRSVIQSGIAKPIWLRCEILLNALAFSRRSSLKTISGFEIGSKSAHIVPAKIGFAMEDGILLLPTNKTY